MPIPRIIVPSIPRGAHAVTKLKQMRAANPDVKPLDLIDRLLVTEKITEPQADDLRRFVEHEERDEFLRRMQRLQASARP